MEAEHFGLWGFASVGFTGSVRYQPIPMTAPTVRSWGRWLCMELWLVIVASLCLGQTVVPRVTQKKSEAYKMVDVIILRFHDGVEATVCSLQKLRSCF